MANLSSEDIINVLANSTFFSETSSTALAKLKNYVEQKSILRNEVVFIKGDQGDAMYVIVDGTFKVHDKSHIYADLKPGDCFGEYALLDDNIRSATVTALSNATLLKIERKYFLDLIDNDEGLTKDILSLLINRHRKLNDIQEKLTNANIELELASSKMKGLIEGAMDAIVMFDKNFRIVLTNPSANDLFENEDVLQRNILFFFDEPSAKIIEELVNSEDIRTLNTHLPEIITVIGSNETAIQNEGTISTYGDANNTFFTLILRNIDERLVAEDKIKYLTNKTEYLSKEIKELTTNHNIIAQDKSMKAVLHLIDQVATTDATVLITGETGTGKELVSRAIHNASNRSDQPLVRINCGAIPHNLIESELFGHKKGAFTGATADRKGRFLLADKGTIFLDEIGELPLELQPKLLRVIQEGEFDPVGSSETLKVDVRIIAATHRNLLEHSQNGKFREDLYYRLNVFPINVPALRERGNDICLIAEEMLKNMAKKLGKPVIQLSEIDAQLLRHYDWPGNVRELQNLIERAVIIAHNGTIDWHAVIPNQNISGNKNYSIEDPILTSKELIQLEKKNILKALKQTKWKISGSNGAAALLQLPPTTLASKIKAFGIERPI